MAAAHPVGGAGANLSLGAQEFHENRFDSQGLSVGHDLGEEMGA